MAKYAPLVRVRLKPLTEAECYARLHGEHDPNVRIVSRTERIEPPPARPRPDDLPRPSRPAVVRMSGEELRRLFERRLDARE